LISFNIIRINSHTPVVSILTFPMILQFLHVQYVCANTGAKTVCQHSDKESYKY